MDLLPQMNERWEARQRPLNAAIERTLQQSAGVWVLDGSILDALLRKVGLLREDVSLEARSGWTLAARWSIISKHSNEMVFGTHTGNHPSTREGTGPLRQRP